MVTRRNFIKTGCAHCTALLGVSFMLEGCTAGLPVFKTSQKDNVISVPESEFRNEKKMIVVRPEGFENDILLVQQGDHYNALYLKCTHEGIGLTPTSKKIVCTAHGSYFDFDGNVLKEPALKPLKKFATKISDNTVFIYLT